MISGSGGKSSHHNNDFASGELVGSPDPALAWLQGSSSVTYIRQGGILLLGYFMTYTHLRDLVVFVWIRQ